MKVQELEVKKLEVKEPEVKKKKKKNVRKREDKEKEANLEGGKAMSADAGETKFLQELKEQEARVERICPGPEGVKLARIQHYD